jgi:REJ domain
VTDDANVPVLSVLGPAYLSVQMSSTISIQAVASLPVCASQKSNIVYKWTVFLQGVDTELTTTSQDSSRFLLPPYQLTVDKTYTVTIYATHGTSVSSTSVTVYVAHGNVNAIVLGGYSRASPINEPLVMNASISTDEDQATGVNLNYKVRDVCRLSLLGLSLLNCLHSPLCPYSLPLLNLFFVRHSGPAP